MLCVSLKLFSNPCSVSEVKKHLEKQQGKDILNYFKLLSMAVSIYTKIYVCIHVYI